MIAASVVLWDRVIGAVSYNDGDRAAVFQYDPDFAQSGIEISPLAMPLRRAPYSFPSLSEQSFHGLPGLLADSLPDRFGNAVLGAWLSRKARPLGSLNPVERLLCIGARGMGALEYRPAETIPRAPSENLDLASLVQLASEILRHRDSLNVRFGADDTAAALSTLLQIGTSAGGARAKAVIAWNPSTQEVRSGQVQAEQGFEHWLLKFDGVLGNKDKEAEDSQKYCRIEYAYSLMAAAAGITLSECRLLREGKRRHFMTRRFDRLGPNGKLHMQSLCGLGHFDFNQAGAYGYEDAFLVMHRLGLPQSEVEEQFRRMVFNVVARNQDDHTKNIAFLMDREGKWHLSPAYDMTYSYNPAGAWTGAHQMTIQGKRDAFTVSDFEKAGKAARLPRGRGRRMLEHCVEVVSDVWRKCAAEAELDAALTRRIASTHRLKWD